MKVGYISRRSEDGKEHFTYMEAEAVRRIGKRTDSVKIPFLYGTYPYEEVLDNTNIIEKNPKIVLVCEPFFTSEAFREKFEKWCLWANSCENREYSFFR